MKDTFQKWIEDFCSALLNSSYPVEEVPLRTELWEYYASGESAKDTADIFYKKWKKLSSIPIPKETF